MAALSGKLTKKLVENLGPVVMGMGQGSISLLIHPGRGTAPEGFWALGVRMWSR